MANEDEKNFENPPKKDRDSFWDELSKQKKERDKHGIDSIDTKQGHHSKKWDKKNRQDG